MKNRFPLSHCSMYYETHGQRVSSYLIQDGRIDGDVRRRLDYPRICAFRGVQEIQGSLWIDLAERIRQLILTTLASRMAAAWLCDIN